MINAKDMGIFFAKQRINNDYTQQEVAELTLVCIKTVQNLELGKKCTDFNTLSKICDLYNISLGELDRFYQREYEMEHAIELYELSDKGKKKKELQLV